MVGLLVFIYRLGDLPIQLWDKSRLANNAIQMVHRREFIVTYYNGNAEIWSTKPPLQVWLMSLSMMFSGFNEWAIRLPSALAALATTLLICWFVTRVTHSRFAGIAASLVLMSTPGYVTVHVTRTADYEALLVFCLTTSFITFFMLVESIARVKRTPRLWLSYSQLQQQLRL